MVFFNHLYVAINAQKKLSGWWLFLLGQSHVLILPG